MLSLTERDQELLSSLCGRVRLFTLEQIASTWWSETKSSKADSRRRLGKLAACDFVQKLRVFAAPLPVLNCAVASWQPSQSPPDFGSVAWKLQKRWEHGPKAATAYIAGRQATKIFGGKPHSSLKIGFQATHDLGVSQMYLQLKASNPEAATRWIGEDVLAPYRKKQKLPDAVIATATSETPELVLEFGGAYDKRRVEEFHIDCERRSLPYEIW